LGFFAPTPLAGQTKVGLGAFVGREFDLSDDWVIFGAQGLIGPPRSALVLNPRFTYHPFDGGSLVQLDLNALYELELARPGILRPYLGLGVGVVRESFDTPTGSESETKPAGNLIAGLRLAFRNNANLSPFLHTQYSAINDFANSYTLSVGINYLFASR
jgi:hypothetical protein